MQKKVKTLRNHTCHADRYLQINRFATQYAVALRFHLFFILPVLYALCIITGIYKYTIYRMIKQQQKKQLMHFYLKVLIYCRNTRFGIAFPLSNFVLKSVHWQ